MSYLGCERLGPESQADGFARDEPLIGPDRKRVDVNYLHVVPGSFVPAEAYAKALGVPNAPVDFGPPFGKIDRTVPSPTKLDLKAGVGTKAPLAQVPKILDVYASRGHQFGAVKYEIGNYMRPPREGVSDVERLLEYISACRRHLGDWSDEIVRFLGGGVNAKATLQEACYAADKESHGPHAIHAAATLGMALQQAADAGLMPADPGKTWNDEEVKKVTRA